MKSIELSGRAALLLLVCTGWFCRETAEGQGMSFSDSLYRAIPALPDTGGGGKAENEQIAQTPKVDLRPYCPRPGRQEDAYSCTGWALGYGAMSISMAIKNGWRGQTDTITRHAFSALFIYNQIKDTAEDCHANSFLGDGLQLLARSGNLPAAEFDRDRNDCRKLPTASQLEAAKRHRIGAYARLFDAQASGREKIDRTKRSLLRQKPVVVGMLIRQNIRNVGPDNRFWIPVAGDTTPIGGHAMVVVGYDDGKGAFELLNSWGEGWGNGGFCWLRYADYARLVMYSFQMSLDSGALAQAPAQPVFEQSGDRSTESAASAAVQLQKLTGWQGDTPQFETIPLLADTGGFYRPDGGAWPLGQLYQLVVTPPAEAPYGYVWTIDGAGRVRVHWPREGNAPAPAAAQRLTVPGNSTVLRIETKGDELVCVALSPVPLRHYPAAIGRLKHTENSLAGSYRQLFNPEPIETAETNTGSAISSETAAFPPNERIFLCIWIRVE